MPEIILWWIIGTIEKGAKHFWKVLAILLLMLPFGFPILMAIILLKKNK
jgi:hypothetical protein